MIQKLNSLVGKKYDADNYHCYHLLEEVLDVPKLLDVHVDTAKEDVAKYINMFEQVAVPYDGCIVLLGRSHIGVYHTGYVYHNDLRGVRAETLRVLKYRYNGFKYYKVKR